LRQEYSVVLPEFVRFPEIPDTNSETFRTRALGSPDRRPRRSRYPIWQRWFRKRRRTILVDPNRPSNGWRLPDKQL